MNLLSVTPLFNMMFHVTRFLVLVVFLIHCHFRYIDGRFYHVYSSKTGMLAGFNVVVGCIRQSNRLIHRYKISRLRCSVWMNFRPLTIQMTFIYLFAIPSILQLITRTRFGKRNGCPRILLVDQPGNDKLCRIRTLLHAVSKVNFT